MMLHIHPFSALEMASLERDLTLCHVCQEPPPTPTPATREWKDLHRAAWAGIRTGNRRAQLPGKRGSGSAGLWPSALRFISDPPTLGPPWQASGQSPLSWFLLRTKQPLGDVPKPKLQSEQVKGNFISAFCYLRKECRERICP